MPASLPDGLPLNWLCSPGLRGHPPAPAPVRAAARSKRMAADGHGRPVACANPRALCCPRGAQQVNLTAGHPEPLVLRVSKQQDACAPRTSMRRQLPPRLPPRLRGHPPAPAPARAAARSERMAADGHGGARGRALLGVLVVGALIGARRCEGIGTGCGAANGKANYYLDKHTTLECTSGALAQWHFRREGCSGINFQVHYACRGLDSPVGWSNGVTTHWTDCDSDGVGDKHGQLKYFDRHNVECPGEGSVLTSWRMWRCSCNNDCGIRFEFKCRPATYTAGQWFARIACSPARLRGSRLSLAQRAAATHVASAPFDAPLGGGAGFALRAAGARSTKHRVCMIVPPSFPLPACPRPRPRPSSAHVL